MCLPWCLLKVMGQNRRAACDCKSRLKRTLLFFLLFWAAALTSQAVPNDAVLAEIGKRLASPEKLTYHKPVVFVGEISRLGPVYQGVCKEAVNQDVEFTISRLLWGDHPGSLIHTGYINCTGEPLPSPPFTLHAKVIVYCEQASWLTCLAPVEFTNEHLSKIESWIATIPRDKGDAVMLAMHDRLQDSSRLAQHRAFVFVGEISRMEAVRRPRCKSGIENKVAYRVSQILWMDPDSVVRSGYVVEKDFIDCAQNRLPPPFDVGVKVIVYCEIKRAYDCQILVPFTDDRLRRVQLWIDELRRTEGDSVLLQIHYRLRDSLELTPSRPFLLFGQVTSVDLPRKFHIGSIVMRPGMLVTVSRLLWGYYKEPEVRALCPFWDCSGIAVGDSVIVYCESPYGPPGQCRFTTTAFTDENVRRVEEWARQARERQPALILDKIRKSLDKRPSDPRWVPSVYRGHIASVTKDDNGFPFAKFVDTTGRYQATINLLFQRWDHTRASFPLEIGKPMITFCYQKDDVCYVGEEALGIIEDSDETFRAIQELIAAEH